MHQEIITMKRQGTMQMTKPMTASATDGTASLGGYLISIEYNPYLEIKFEKERKKNDMM